jgi:hypothetical protein
MKSWRVWGLIANFIGNALAVYGLGGLIKDGSRLLVFSIGICITVVCLLLLAKPSGDAQNIQD